MTDLEDAVPPPQHDVEYKASAPQRCPMDLVLIIDVSYSMSPAMEDAPCQCGFVCLTKLL